MGSRRKGWMGRVDGLSKSVDAKSLMGKVLQSGVENLGKPWERRSPL